MFRFTIRDVLWLTVVVALAIIAWRSESSRRTAARENAELKRRNEWQAKLIRSVPITGADTFDVPDE